MESVGKSIGITKLTDGDLREKLTKFLGHPRKDNVECFTKVEYDAPVLIDPKPLLEKYGVQKRHQHISFNSIRNYRNNNECDKRSFNETYQYGQHIRNAIDTGKGLILQGKVGTGKTTLAIAIMRKAVEQGIRCLFVNNISLNDKLLNFFGYLHNFI